MSAGDIASVLLIAVGLSADCFAVALGGSAGVNKAGYIRVFRTALAFGLAQAFMPVVGWAVGRTVIDFVTGFVHWIAFGLLLIIGGRMIWEALRERDKNGEGIDISRGFILVTLAFATSIDALAVGLSFAFLEVNIALAGMIIGIIAFFITNLGFYFGRKAGNILGRRAKIAGGAILIAIAIKVVLSYLLA